MRVANNIAFGTLSCILSGAQKVVIKHRHMGYWQDEIFKGDMAGLSERSKQPLIDQLAHMKVNAIHAGGDVLFIGVETR